MYLYNFESKQTSIYIANLKLTFYSSFLALRMNKISEHGYQRGDRLYTSESDVCRRQILTYKDGPRTERIKIFLMAADPEIKMK